MVKLEQNRGFSARPAVVIRQVPYAGGRSQVTGHIKIKEQSVILAMYELPEIPKGFMDISMQQMFHCIILMKNF